MMREIEIAADDLVKALVNLPALRGVCLLDSGGAKNLGSRFLIAGFDAVEVLEINNSDANKTLAILDEKTSNENLAAILTISYEFGLKLNSIKPRPKEFSNFAEPDIYIALFDCLIVHDYETQKTFLTGNSDKFDWTEKVLFDSLNSAADKISDNSIISQISSNFSPSEYCAAVRKVQEFIRRGDTYQTNLTQQFRVSLPENFSPENSFLKLRNEHPAAFAAFLRRANETVISASPERFLKVKNLSAENVSEAANLRQICVSPIKGTRPRGKTAAEDARLRTELLMSEKDRAENVMIVDLLRNDIGRICEFGSVAVEKICELEIHSTLFHLVSTVRGNLRRAVKFSDILKAVFPCGSITGAPKIRTMQIIDALETAPRGLSMGAIGYVGFDKTIDLNVAIRTAIVQRSAAIFNVGGGIVIDSVPESEYAETLVKAQVLLKILNAETSFKV